MRPRQFRVLQKVRVVGLDKTVSYFDAWLGLVRWLAVAEGHDHQRSTMRRKQPLPHGYHGNWRREKFTGNKKAHAGMGSFVFDGG